MFNKISVFALAFLLTGGVAFAGQTNCSWSDNDYEECVTEVTSRQHTTEKPIGYVAYTEASCNYAILKRYDTQDFLVARITASRYDDPVRQQNDVYNYSANGFDTRFREGGKAKVTINSDRRELKVYGLNLTMPEAVSFYVEKCI